MGVLYLTEDYFYSKVHHNLSQSISEQDVDFFVFSIRREKGFFTNLKDSYGDIKYTLNNVEFDANMLLYRTLFPYKQKYKYNKLKDSIAVNNVSLVHASTLFSDGALAYRIFREFGIPYIICVRGTDLNLYAGKLVHLWKLGLDIMKNAERIIFISTSCRDQLFKHVIYRRYKDLLWEKTCVIPNGVDEIWIENMCFERHQFKINSPKLIYIGRFDDNKNVLSLVKAIVSLRASFPEIRLTLIGGGGVQDNMIKSYCDKYPETFVYLGKIYDKEKLIGIMREHDIFAMVSHSETFGLVYVEALSQGLPVLYSKGQGIDGVFKEHVGEPVNSHDVKSIEMGLFKLINNYDNYDKIEKILPNYSWVRIAKQYINVYNSVLR